MKTNLAILFVTLFVIGISTYFFNNTRPSFQEVPISVSDIKTDKEVAPNFSMRDIHNKAYELTDFKGRIIIINFWASWCAPCVIEFPQLLDMARAYPDDVTLLTISVDEEKRNIETFLKKIHAQTKQPTDMPNVYYIWDPKKKISQDIFATVKYPETYILSPDLTIQEKIIGAGVDFSSPDFLAHLMTYRQ
jgi:cytochrome c biogenesis protein CcmG, thiol:disulfide interchange protein DsbE